MNNMHIHHPDIKIRKRKKITFFFMILCILLYSVPFSIFAIGIYLKQTNTLPSDYFAQSYQQYKHNEIISQYLLDAIRSNISTQEKQNASFHFIQLLKKHIADMKSVTNNNTYTSPFILYYKYLLAQEFLALRNKNFAMLYLNDIIRNYDFSNPLYPKKIQNIVYHSLIQLNTIEQDPYQGIIILSLLLKYYDDNISSKSSVYYALGKHYDTTAQWSKAYNAYQDYLSYKGDTLVHKAKENREHIFLRLRRQTLSGQKKAVIWDDAESARKSILRALYSYNSSQIKRLQSSIFFTAHWFETLIDSNTYIPNFDIKPVLTRSNISVANHFSQYSTDNSKLWRTSGWGRVPVWHFVINKIALPNRADINGKWEWAGIYFGEGNERYIPTL